MLAGEPIDVYNHGRMQRDFTYIDDLVAAIYDLAKAVPERDELPPDINEQLVVELYSK